jgi:hypothetical protein
MALGAIVGIEVRDADLIAQMGEELGREIARMAREQAATTQ